MPPAADQGLAGRLLFYVHDRHAVAVDLDGLRAQRPQLALAGRAALRERPDLEPGRRFQPGAQPRLQQRLCDARRVRAAAGHLHADDAAGLAVEDDQVNAAEQILPYARVRENLTSRGVLVSVLYKNVDDEFLVVMV